MALQQTNGEKAIEAIHYQTGERVSLVVRDQRIAEIRPMQGIADGRLPWIGPGLVDLQINGYGGMDLNTPPVPKERVIALTRQIWGEGVTSYFPTVVTNSDSAIEQALHSIVVACEQDERVERTIAGIHVEGPFISPLDGPRGAHPKEFVKPPDWSLFQRWQDAAGGKIKIVTLSPEWPGATEFIEKCVEYGVTASIGHTSATPEQIQAAVSSGARMSTHLGNGSHLMLPRHPNYLWEQLAEDNLWACFIADGFHLPDAVMKVVLRAKLQRAMLVSDAVYLGGMEPGEYDVHIGGKVVLTDSGKLHLAGNSDILAGSAQMLPWGIEYLAKSRLCSIDEAWELASVRPAMFMDLPSKNGLTVGAPADFVLFQWSDHLRIEQTYLSGQLVFSAT